MGTFRRGRSTFVRARKCLSHSAHSEAETDAASGGFRLTHRSLVVGSDLHFRRHTLARAALLVDQVVGAGTNRVAFGH
jgi:hypothetical protein